MHSLQIRSTPKHFLSPSLFLEIDASEHVHASMAHVSEKTFRKWTWAFVNHIADLKVVFIDIFPYTSLHSIGTTSVLLFLNLLDFSCRRLAG